MESTTAPARAGDTAASSRGLQFERRHCHEGRDPYMLYEWAERTASIADDKGRVIFEQKGCRFPAHFSQLAVNITASKYFYGDQAGSPDGPAHGGREDSFAQVVHRVVDTISKEGSKGGYFASEADGKAFHDDLVALMLGQYGCFNSPVLFNVGLHEQYGIKGSCDGWYWDSKVIYRPASSPPREGELLNDKLEGVRVRGPMRIPAGHAYKHPQASACFIQSVQDDMESILDLLKAEGMLFKYGSGTGTDLSTLRSTREKLSGGGKPSGPVSFLKVFDTLGGVIKSGGKTRRAARMQTLKCVHPDIMEFIGCKPQAERMARDLIAAGWPADYNSVVYSGLDFQNTNLSIRVTDEFCAKWAGDDPVDNWQTLAVTTGTARGNNGQTMPIYPAHEVGRAIAEGTHLCGDPGLQFEDTVQRWHTCPNTAPINSSNPCSEFMFVDDSSCNLASLNLLKFRLDDGTFDAVGYQHAARIFITAQEILVDYAGYPTAKICANSHKFRPLGLGYANLGALIMSYGLPYDGPAARALCGELTAMLHGTAYHQSARMAGALGAFDGFEANRGPMLRVIDRHRDALALIQEIGPDECPADVHQILDSLHWLNKDLWWAVEKLGIRHGFRNSQVTVLAPTGTIGFVMDCDTLGIEPDIALVKYKLLAGGGNLKFVNQTIPLGLRTLGYGIRTRSVDAGLETVDEVKEIVAYIDANDTIEGCPALKPEHLPVFDCAFTPAKGVRSIHHSGHVGMMAAAQPFISGAISKSVNLPEDATVEEVEATFLSAWRAGLKAIAIYRDNSKGSQPLTTKKVEEVDPYKPLVDLVATINAVSDPFEAFEQAKVLIGELTVRPQAADCPPRREKLPARRRAETLKFRIAGHKGYIHAGFYPDGRLGEVFVTMDGEGSSLGGLMNSWSAILSMALQYGAPLEVFVDKFSYFKFEPLGPTGDPDVPIAHSLVDFIVRKLWAAYPGGKAAAYAPEDETADTADDEAPEPVPAPTRGLRADTRICETCQNLAYRAGSCYVCATCGTTNGCG